MTESLKDKVKQLVNEGNAREAISLLQNQADQGDGQAMYALGCCYAEGWTDKPDEEKALLWYGRAWDAPDTEEIKGKIADSIGDIHFQRKLNFQEAARWYRKSAERGYDWGYCDWGSCFAWGLGESKNTPKALELYKKAYELHGEAEGVTANDIGHVYQGETGEKPDYKKAVSWFRKSAKAGYSWGMYNLASASETGLGTELDREKAFYLYQDVLNTYDDDAAAQAANRMGLLLRQKGDQNEDAYALFCLSARLGSTWGMYNAGSLLRDGINGKPDMRRAIKWFSQAYNRHEEASGIAANSLGLIYSDEDFEWFSMEKACRWFRKSASLGYGWGAYNLADNYALGRGVKYNPKKAIKYYTMAYEQEDEASGEAANRLGMLYENGLQGLSVDFSKALAWYRKSVDLGCAPGLYDLAGMYDQGKGCTMDKKKALQLYERAYDMMDEVSGYAACRIGEIYKAGIGIRPDMKKAFFWYERAAESHLEEAFFALGECYEHGEGTELDSEQAMTWYKKAYDCGGEYAGRASCRIALILEQCREPSEKLDKEILQWLQKSADEEFDWGILNLADAYLHGSGVKADGKKAAELLTRVYLMGDEAAGEAANSLTLMYAGGSAGLKQDMNKAIDWAKKSAELDQEFGYYTLGKCYLNGVIVPMDRKKALDYFGKAWNKKGKSEAECAEEIGMIYLQGADGIPANLPMAMEWFTRGAEAGSTDSCLFLGNCYQHGMGVEPDGEKAISYFTRACKPGAPSAEMAIMNIGSIYEEGMEGVEKNPEIAIQWYQKGAEEGLAMCAAHLGDCYLNGRNGLDIDMEQAMSWYEKASHMEGLGAGVALARMGEIYDYLGGNQFHDMKKAMEFYTRAADVNCAAGAFHMGECYEMGRGVAMDGVKAIEWYSRASVMFGEESIRAIENLVNIFRHGAVGVEPDENRAAFWEMMLTEIPSTDPVDTMESMINDTQNTTIN